MSNNLPEKVKIETNGNEEISLGVVVENLREWSTYVLSKWFILLAFIILGALAGFGYAYFKKPVYTASTTFVLEESGGVGGGAMGQYAGLASMVGIDLGGGSNGLFSGDNITALYKSRNMLQKVLLSTATFSGKKEQLIHHYIEFNQLRDKWAGYPALQNISFADTSKFTLLQDSIMGEVVDDINLNYLSILKPDKKASIIQVQVIAKDQAFAKAFSDQVVATVNDFYVQTKMKKSTDNLAILQHQTDSVRAVMNGAIYASASTMDATPNLNPTRQVLRAPIQRSQFNAEANKAILGELIKNLELSKISLRKETPLIQVIDKPVIPLKKDKAGKLKSMVLGAFLFGFMSLLYLSLRRILS